MARKTLTDRLLRTLKTDAADTGKIALIKSLVEQSLDLDRFLEVAVRA